MQESWWGREKGTELTVDCWCLTKCWATGMFTVSQPPLGFTENGAKNREYPARGSRVEESALLLSGVTVSYTFIVGMHVAKPTNEHQFVSPWGTIKCCIYWYKGERNSKKTDTPANKSQFEWFLLKLCLFTIIGDVTVPKYNRKRILPQFNVCR